MTYEPTLRLRRGQSHLVANLLAIAIIVVWAAAFMAWDLMPGPTENRPDVVVPPRTRICKDPTEVSDPNC